MTENNQSRTERAPKPQLWLKIAALVLVIAALGLPINDLFRYALLVISTVFIVFGCVSARAAPWLGAIAVLAFCVLGQIFVPALRIEEGHNVFLIDRGGGALEAGLPGEAFRLMAHEFDGKYPPVRRCDPRLDGCWRGQAFPTRPFAFSADAMGEHPRYSRRVAAIDFADPVWLRLGFINERGYNWNSAVSDVKRDSRDRRFFAFVHRWRLEMPWFVMYRFPAEFVGSDLCWRGEVLWEGANERFEAISHASMECRTLGADDIGSRIFGVAIKQEPPLAMRLAPSATVRLRQLLEPAFALIACTGIVGLLVRIRRRQAALPFALIAVTLVVVFFTDASFIGGVRPFDAGDDGLVYDGFARSMLRQFLSGDFASVLEGGEPVFYFTPGMRYLRVVEHLIFGETYLGYLSLILLLPFLVLAMFRRFLPESWGLPLTFIFAAIPIGMLFGSSLVQYVKWAARGFADPAAYVFFLAGFVLLIGRTQDGPGNRYGAAFGSGFLFALALFVRPNIVPAVALLLGGAGAAALWQRQYRRVTGLALGFLAVVGVPLHNWIYGGVFVPITTTAAHPGALVMPPATYLSAVSELMHLDFAGAYVRRALEQIGGWLAGPSEHVATAPLNAAALLVLVRVALWPQRDGWLRLTAWATLVQQCVGLFYATPGRYYYLTWLLTLLIVAVWAHREGLPVLRGNFRKPFSSASSSAPM